MPNTPQEAGHPTRNQVHERWRNSILVGPQTAGIPTVHNEDEWANPGDRLSSDNTMAVPRGEADPTGGVLSYHNSQRRK